MSHVHDDQRARRARVERGVYRQPNGKYAICFMLDGKPRFRTVDGDLDEARAARARFGIAAQAGLVPACPRLTFATVAGRWLERFEAMVAVGERRERTLDSHRYHLEHHLLPVLGRRRIATITVDDIADLIVGLVAQGRAPRTITGALGTLGSILRYALRRGYITDNPLPRLEAGERPRPVPRTQRALGQEEIARLLSACAPHYRLLIVTALYTGMRISELLALIWSDVNFTAGVIHVRAQLSRAQHGNAARRVPPKTAAAIRDIPLVDQLAGLLREHRCATPFDQPGDYIFSTGNGTPLGHRNLERRALQRAAAAAGIVPAPRFHGLRHTFASHLIIDLGLDVAQVSRILGHASVTTTLNIYTHLFDDARHATEIRTRMASSAFARLLEPDADEADNVVGVVGTADPEQVAHLKPLGEPLHLIAPLRGTVMIAHPLAAKDQIAAAPADGNGSVDLARDRRGRRLVEQVHSLLDLAVADQGQSLDGDPDQFQVGVPEFTSELGGLPARLATDRPVALELDGDRRLMQRQPAMLGTRLQALEQAMGTAEPAVRDRELAAKLEVVDRGPSGHSCGAAAVAAAAVELVCAPARAEDRLGVIHVPGGPAEAVVGLRRLFLVEGPIEVDLRRVPIPIGERLTACPDQLGERLS